MNEEYKFGQIYEEKIDIEDADYYSNIFGEGSKALTELIKYCILNDIRTFASCKGHPEDKNVFDARTENGYIAFRIDDNHEFAYFLASLAYIIPNIKILVDYNIYTYKKTVSIEVPATRKNMSEKYFNKILEEIKRYNEVIKSGEDYYPNEDVIKVIDYVFYMPTSTSFYITNRNFIRVDKPVNIYDSIINKCPRSEKTGVLHNLFCEILNKPKNIDELINMNIKK